MPVVELIGVTKAYDTKVAVSQLSLSIEAGQMFGLLGPNGAGKTSSIRMMMGITIPDTGQIKLFNRPFDRRAWSGSAICRRTRPLQEDEGPRPAHLLWRTTRPRRRGSAQAIRRLG